MAREFRTEGALFECSKESENLGPENVLKREVLKEQDGFQEVFYFLKRTVAPGIGRDCNVNGVPCYRIYMTEYISESNGKNAAH